MSFRIGYILVLFCILSCSLYGQDPKVDSLSALLKTTTTDTGQVAILNQLFELTEFSNPDQAETYLKKSMELCEKAYYKKGAVLTHTHFGYLAEDRGDYNEALKNYREGLELAVSLNDKRSMGASYNNMGNVFYFQGNYPDAFTNYFKSLKIRELLNDKQGIADAYSNLGLVQMAQGSYSQALENYSDCLELYRELNNKKGIAIAYDHVGLVYYYQHEYIKALENYKGSLLLFEELGEKRRMAGAYNNMGGVYCDLGQYDEALKNYLIALKLRDKRETKGIADSYGNIGIALMKQKKYAEARPYLYDSEALLKKIGAKENLRKAYTALAFFDSATGNFKGAYEHYKLFVLVGDSIDNEVTRRKTIQSQMNYDFEKKEAIAEAEHTKELENQESIANEKSHKQKVILVLVSCFLILVLLFAGFVFRSLRITRRQKEIIELQKKEVEQQKQEVEQQKTMVEEHQKEIIDSITYARRIQLSLLPSEKYIERSLKRLNQRSGS